MDSCILCDQKAILTKQDNSSRTIYNCANCGVFVVSDLVEDAIRERKGDVRAFMTHRKITGAPETVFLSFEKAKLDKSYLQMTVDQIAALAPQTFSEQMEMALINLAKMSPYPGAEIRIEMLTSSPIFYLRHNNVEALAFIIKAMMERKYIDIKNYGASFFPCSVTISPTGWDAITALEQRTHVSVRPKLVLACRAGCETSEAVEAAAGKAARDCKMQLISNALIPLEGHYIGNELAARIKAGNVIVIDFTGSQPECYYALGYAQALNKHVLLICHEKERKKLQLDATRTGVTFWIDEKQLQLEITNFINAKR